MNVHLEKKEKKKETYRMFHNSNQQPNYDFIKFVVIHNHILQ